MPWVRDDKCVYKKKSDGSRGEKKGCSDTVTKAKKYMKRLYALGEIDEAEEAELLTFETDDMVFGGGGDPEAEEGDEGELEEALIREWVRYRLLLEQEQADTPIPTEVTTENIGEFLKNISTNKSDSVSAKKAEMSGEKLKAALIEDPTLAQSLQASATSQKQRKIAFQFILASECCGFDELFAVTGTSMPEEEKLSAILDFVEGDYALSDKKGRQVGLDIKNQLGDVVDRTTDGATAQRIQEVIGGILYEKMTSLIGSPGHEKLTRELVDEFRNQLSPGAKSENNQTRFNFEGGFKDPVKKALKEITKEGSTWEVDLAEALQKSIGRMGGSSDGAVVVPIGRRSENNVWTGGDYPGFMVVPNLIKDYIVGGDGALKISEDSELIERLATNKLIKGVMVITRTSAGIQNELDAAEDLLQLTAGGEQIMSIPTGDGSSTIDIAISGAGHNSSEDPAIRAAVQQMQQASGVTDVKPDMFFKVVNAETGAEEVKGVSIKKKNAEYALSGDRILGDLVDAILNIAKKDKALADALNSGDVRFDLEAALGEVGADVAEASVFGAGTNRVDYVLKGDFSKTRPELNSETGKLEYPANSGVKLYSTFDEFLAGEPYPSLVFRRAEAGRGGRKTPDGQRTIRPVIMFTSGRGDDQTSAVSGDAGLQVAGNNALQLMQAHLEILRNIIHESLLLEDLDRSDRSEIKRMISKEIEGVTNRRQIEKTFQTQFDKELRKALGVSFFGTPGKINKFVVDAINDEVARILGDKATRQMMADITKEVLVRLYKELSFHQEPVIRRIKI
tara:strand:- start:1746 stop:4124 length:2379 start_codon:yes stop_codon:yes gene_type:complete